MQFVDKDRIEFMSYVPSFDKIVWVKTGPLLPLICQLGIL